MALAPASIMERLALLYGEPEHVPHGDAVAELVLTVLSQNTADTNSGRAFIQLMRRYPSWEAVTAAPPDEVVATIQGGGLARQKGPRIQAILAAVRERSPGWNLDFLADLPLEEARAWLRSLPGVGPKTAACVLLFALGRPAMPVDTHVERVSRRLGLIPPKMTVERAHEALEALVSSNDYYRFHMLLIKHGRRLCAARRPECGRCPLEPDCPASLLRQPAVQAGVDVSAGAPSA
jgi:endonuclease-3